MHLLKSTFTTVIIILAVFLCSAGAENPDDKKTVRNPVAAGMFYPADPEELKGMINDLTRKAGCDISSDTPGVHPAAMIMPHAGYAFSGLTAAHAACFLKGHNFSKIIILAPDHRVGFHGGALTSANAFRTPLGDVPIGADASRLIARHS